VLVGADEIQVDPARGGADPARRSRFSAAHPDWAPRTSTSRTSIPRPPVAMATLACGQRAHQARTTSASVDASRTPWAVSGAFSAGRTGRTGTPRDAHPRAAADRSLVASTAAHLHPQRAQTARTPTTLRHRARAQ
jgi:hypothetical protein